MLSYALLFPVVGLIPGALGLAGSPPLPARFVWVLFLVGAAPIALHLVTWRHPPVA